VTCNSVSFCQGIGNAIQAETGSRRTTFSVLTLHFGTVIK
jgi:hypothetical protein